MIARRRARDRAATADEHSRASTTAAPDNGAKVDPSAVARAAGHDDDDRRRRHDDVRRPDDDAAAGNVDPDHDHDARTRSPSPHVLAHRRLGDAGREGEPRRDDPRHRRRRDQEPPVLPGHHDRAAVQVAAARCRAVDRHPPRDERPRSPTTLFDQIMQTIGPKHTVYFLTARVPRSWETEVNATLHDGATRWPNAHVLEWHDFAGCHDDWFVERRLPPPHRRARPRTPTSSARGLLGKAPTTCTKASADRAAQRCSQPVDELQEPVPEVERRCAAPSSLRCHGTAGGASSAGRVMPGIRPRSTTLPHFGHVASGRTVDGVRNLLQFTHQGIRRHWSTRRPTCAQTRDSYQTLASLRPAAQGRRRG